MNILSAKTLTPTFITEPASDVQFANTKGVLIPCQGNGNPLISWQKDDGSSVDHINKNGSQHHLRYVRPQEGSLIFSPFKANDYRPDIHSSVYRCLAKYSFGTIRSKDVHVHGHGKTDFYIYSIYHH